MESAKFREVLEQCEFDILLGVFKPRQRLVEDELMVRYKTSRFIIRKVLKELESKAIVRHHTNRGAAVADLTEKEALDIYSARLLLEEAALDGITEKIDKKRLNLIIKYNRDFIKAIRENNLRIMITANIHFHHSILEVSGNSVLSDLIDQMRTRSHLLRHITWRQPGRLEKSIEEHKQMIECIRKKDDLSLKRINRNHIVANLEVYIGKTTLNDRLIFKSYSNLFSLILSARI